MRGIATLEVERIRHDTDLVALVRARGVELRPAGSGIYTGTCPFCKQPRPALAVHAVDRTIRCASCGLHGDAVEFLLRYDGVSRRHAFELLKSGTPAFSAPGDGPRSKLTVPRLENPFAHLSDTATDASFLRRVADYYHERLLQSPSALAYLRAHGLHHDEAIRTFRLGLSDRTLGLRIPGMNRRNGAAIRTRLQRLGIYRTTGREHLNGCIVFPVFAPPMEGSEALMAGTPAATDQVVAALWGCRLVGAKTLCLPQTPATLWNLPAHGAARLPREARADAWILCQTPFDALTFWVNGFRTVTFTGESEGLTDGAMSVLRAGGIRRIKIAYPNTETGNRAAARDAFRLLADGIECSQVRFPWGMGANRYARTCTSAGTALRSALDSARWVQFPCEVSGGGPHATDVPTTVQNHGPVASAMPEPTRLTREAQHLVLRLNSREYRVGGLDENRSLRSLKVAVRLRVLPAPEQGCAQSRVKTPTGHGTVHAPIYLDCFDIARDRDRCHFIERAALETGVAPDIIRQDMGALLLALEQVWTVERETTPGLPNNATTSTPTVPARVDLQAVSPECLPPAAHAVLQAIVLLVDKPDRRDAPGGRLLSFTRQDLREVGFHGRTQLRSHLARLCEAGYLTVHHGAPGQALQYRLLPRG